MLWTKFFVVIHQGRNSFNDLPCLRWTDPHGATVSRQKSLSLLFHHKNISALAVSHNKTIFVLAVSCYKTMAVLAVLCHKTISAQAVSCHETVFDLAVSYRNFFPTSSL